MSGSRLVLPAQQPVQNTGLPYAGGKLFFYVAGTTTPANTYQDQGLVTPNTNPVILDSAGDAGNVFLDTSIIYKVVLEDSNGNLIWTFDPVYPFALGNIQSLVYAGTTTGSINAQNLSGLPAPYDGQTIVFTAGFTNTTTATLNTGAGAVLFNQVATSGPGVLSGGEIVTGNTYFATYRSALNANSGGWQIIGPTFSLIQSLVNISVAAAIAALRAQTPQRTVYTTGSSLTYTTPAGATYLEVEGVGGGSGGGGGGTTTSGGAGGIGGNTTFGAGLTAHGGAATPTSGATTPSTPATATGGDVNISGGRGGNSAVSQVNAVGPAAMSGANSMFGAGGAGSSFITNGSNVVVPATSGTGFGSGGGGGGPDITGSAFINTGFGGNSGAYFRKLITSPTATYTYTVGAAGAAGAAGSSGTGGAAGAGGLIIVTAYFQ